MEEHPVRENPLAITFHCPVSLGAFFCSFSSSVLLGSCFRGYLPEVVVRRCLAAAFRAAGAKCRARILLVPPKLLSVLLSTLLAVAGVVLVLGFCWGHQGVLRHSAVRGAFVVPGYPLVGNALQVLDNPSRAFMEWARRYNKTSFVIYLGSTPALVANCYADVHELLNHHLIAMCSRPSLYTFHKVVSAVQGLTVGSTPFGASFQRKKKCISLHLLSRAVGSDQVSAVLDLSSQYILRHVLSECLDRHRLLGRASDDDVSLLRHAQCYVLRCALALTYGYCIDTHGAERSFADEIITTENSIIRLRSLISNYQDYLPFMNFGPVRYFSDSNAEHWRTRRDQYMQNLYETFRTRLQNANPEVGQCMLAHVLSEKPSANTVSAAELQSICLTMVSAGLDNLALTFDHLMGQLAVPSYGYAIQEKLFQSLLALNDGNVIAAWKNVIHAMDCDYALALIHEALRFFTVLPLSLPRLTTKPFNFKGMAVPADTIVIINAYAANHDPEYFTEPFSFMPDRWLDTNGKLVESSHLAHFSFGSGSRKCSGNHLSMRELYILVCRMVLLFRVKRPTNANFTMEQDPFVGNSCPTATSFEPKEFKVWLQPRVGPSVHELHDLVNS